MKTRTMTAPAVLASQKPIWALVSEERSGSGCCKREDA